MKGWPHNPASLKRPQIVGKLTNELVYEKLPDGVLKQLREVNPATGGRRKYKHHQFLTADIGNPHLEKQVTAVTTLMRVSRTWTRFKTLFDRAFPKPQPQSYLPGLVPEIPDDEDD